MAAYQLVRIRLWEGSQKTGLDVEHAENGMAVLTSVLCLAASIYEAVTDPSLSTLVFFALFLLFFFGTYFRAYYMHSMECMEMKNRVEEVKRIFPAEKEAN